MITLPPPLQGPVKCMQVYMTLHGHGDRVNCVHWVTTRSGQSDITKKGQRELVSGAADGSVCVWKETEEEEARNWLVRVI